MKIKTYLFNWLIMYLCYAASRRFYWVFAQLFRNEEGKIFPPITVWLFQNPWILWLVPLSWGIATVFFLFDKKTPEKKILHTVISFFLGFFVIFCYLWVAFLQTPI